MPAAARLHTVRSGSRDDPALPAQPRLLRLLVLRAWRAFAGAGECAVLAEAGYRRGGGGIVRVRGAGLPEATIEMLLARLDGEQVEAPLYVRATLRLRASAVGRAVL